DTSDGAASAVEIVVTAAELDLPDDLARIDDDVVGAVGIEDVAGDRAAIDEVETARTADDRIGPRASPSTDPRARRVVDRGRDTSRRVYVDSECVRVNRPEVLDRCAGNRVDLYPGEAAKDIAPVAERD